MYTLRKSCDVDIRLFGSANPSINADYYTTHWPPRDKSCDVIPRLIHTRGPTGCMVHSPTHLPSNDGRTPQVCPTLENYFSNK